jgi:hypothetical protein
MCLQFGFLIFWQKDFGAKAAHKMLVKLTPGGSLDPRFVLQHLFCEKLQNCQLLKNRWGKREKCASLESLEF